jgi:hypothetical protein
MYEAEEFEFHNSFGVSMVDIIQHEKVAFEMSKTLDI